MKHLCHRLLLFFHHKRSGVQPGDLQKILHQCLHSIQLLLREIRKLPDIRQLLSLLLHQPVVNIQRRQRRFQLMRNVRNRVPQKFLFPLLLFHVSTQHRRQTVHGVKEPIQLPFLVTCDAPVHLPGDPRLHLGHRLLKLLILFLKIREKNTCPRHKKHSKNGQHPH